MGRGKFLEAVADDEDAAASFDGARRGRQRQPHHRYREGGPHRVAQPSRHRPLCSALGRRCRLAPLAVAGLALALTLPGCGSQSTAAPAEPAEATVIAPSAESPPTSTRGDASIACASALTAFVAQLEHLRRSLVIGVSYEQYVAELGAVRKSYQRVPVGKLDLACVSGPATSAEKSFDGYLAAANAWGDCVEESGCETAALEPRLRREWRAAAVQLAEAKEALEPG